VQTCACGSTTPPNLTASCPALCCKGPAVPRGTSRRTEEGTSEEAARPDLTVKVLPSSSATRTRTGDNGSSLRLACGSSLRADPTCDVSLSSGRARTNRSRSQSRQVVDRSHEPLRDPPATRRTSEHLANAGDCFAADSPTAYPARACPAPTAGTTTRAGAAPGTRSSARARPASGARTAPRIAETPGRSRKCLTLVRARSSHLRP
jgi:hypothetical protein